MVEGKDDVEFHNTKKHFEASRDCFGSIRLGRFGITHVARVGADGSDYGENELPSTESLENKRDAYHIPRHFLYSSHRPGM